MQDAVEVKKEQGSSGSHLAKVVMTNAGRQLVETGGTSISPLPQPIK